MSSDRPPRQSRVPTTRVGRLVQLGFTAGELAIGGVLEGARRVIRATPDDAVNMFLTAANAEKLAYRLAGMRGAAMKMGQMLSMESADILPREFTDALAALRDSASRMPRSQVRGVLGREYGKGWEARFEHFDYEPIAAASIGQVHRATARDGRELALKIQYPGVAKSIDSDVDNMAMFMQVANILPVDPTFVVPRAHADLTTKRVLAMDYMTGDPIESLESLAVAQAVRDRCGTKLQQLLFRELFEFRTMQTSAPCRRTRISGTTCTAPRTSVWCCWISARQPASARRSPRSMAKSPVR
jgi:predicted unusual protein kinase regulating ubiquinone biosynthesis (AarF/ABC1/UbiB family)